MGRWAHYAPQWLALVREAHWNLQHSLAGIPDSVPSVYVRDHGYAWQKTLGQRRGDNFGKPTPEVSIHPSPSRNWSIARHDGCNEDKTACRYHTAKPSA